MGNLINLAVYNPAILDDDEFLEGFVARRELTERLLNRLREVTSNNLARHLLIIGQRGMGKTSMLRRLALGVAQEPALADILIPLTFREEQYNVHNLHVFWCNCLDALGDYLEKHGQRDLAAQLDREIGKLASAGEDPDGNAACQLFKEWCSKEGKRPLLLVDNIDLIFGGLKEQQQWGLRRILQERGGVVMVGASAGLLEAVVKNEAPFFDFFQVHQLEKLSHQELLSCLRQIGLKRGEAGAKVIKVLDGDPARIQTLYDLTGGNPRTLVLLYLLLELDSGGDVMDDLERLLDQVTALYKARVEDLAPQTRVVLDAVALAWNPVTVAKVAAETGIEATSVSSQFDRLMKMGILEKVSLSTPAPVGYQLGERFFNIWYLMRNASRRMRNRLRWLTEFLRRLYTPQQLSSDIGHSLVSHPKPLVDQPENRLNICCHTRWGPFLARNGFPEEAEQAYRKALELDPSDAVFWNGLGCLLHDHMGKLQDAEAGYRKAIELGNGAPYPHTNLAYLLLAQPARAEEADDAFATAGELLPEHGKQLLSAFRALAKDNFGEAGKCLAQALEQNHPELFTIYFDGLLRSLRLAKKEGYGERLLDFLRERGLGDRYWPLYAAFDAYVNEEGKLRDVNPEVRGAARRIFDWLISTPEEKEMLQDSGKKKGRGALRKR